MTEQNARFETLARALGVAAVLAALALLAYIAVGLESPSIGALGIGVGVLLLSILAATGAWTDDHRLRLAGWPASLALVVLGFVGIAVGPQILGVAALAACSTALQRRS